MEDASAKTIHERLHPVYGESAPSYATVKLWANEFQRERESLEDEPRSCRPTSNTTQENIDAVHDLVLKNRRISLHE